MTGLINVFSSIWIKIYTQIMNLAPEIDVCGEKMPLFFILQKTDFTIKIANRFMI